MYDDIKNLEDSSKALLNFLESAYVAGATLAGWNIDEWKVPALEDL